MYLTYTEGKARNLIRGGDYSTRGFPTRSPPFFMLFFFLLQTFLSFVNQLKAIYSNEVSHAAVITNFTVIEQLEEGGEYGSKGQGVDPRVLERDLSQSYHYHGGTRWCSWLRHCVTSRKVAVSIPDGVIGNFH